MTIRKIKCESKLWVCMAMIFCLAFTLVQSAPAEELKIEIRGEGAVMVSTGTDNETLVKELPWSGEMELNTSVTLKAFPDVFGGWEFSNWDGDLSASTNPVTIIMDNDKNIIVTFVEKKEDAIQR